MRQNILPTLLIIGLLGFAALRRKLEGKKNRKQFAYQSRDERTCNYCGARQRKYYTTRLGVQWWEHITTHDRRCPCHTQAESSRVEEVQLN